MFTSGLTNGSSSGRNKGTNNHGIESRTGEGAGSSNQILCRGEFGLEI
jgi:hypothetical protein